MTTATNAADIAPSGATASTTAAEETIAMLREQIDALDAALLHLVEERTRVSRRIQAARMNTGGTRVELGRERVVLAAYREALGPSGGVLAEAVLQVCRGTR